jgi:hypothetical protein
MPILTKAANSHTDVVDTWATQTNAYSTTSDDQYATHTQASRNGTAEIRFGFPSFTTSDIPDGSTINSVKVSAEAAVNQSIGSVIGITIENPSGTDVGTSVETSNTTDTLIECSASTIPSLQNLRDQTVFAHFLYDRANSSTSETVRIDYVSITVDYTPGAVTTVTHAQAQAQILALTTYNTYAQALSLIIIRATNIGQAAALIATTPQYNYVYDSFTRTEAQGWGTSDTGAVWSFPTNDYTSVSDGKAIKSLAYNTFGGLYNVVLPTKWRVYFEFGLSSSPDSSVTIAFIDGVPSTTSSTVANDGKRLGVFIWSDSTIRVITGFNKNNLTAIPSGNPVYQVGETWAYKGFVNWNGTNIVSDYRLENLSTGASYSGTQTGSATTADSLPGHTRISAWSISDINLYLDNVELSRWYDNGYAQAQAQIVTSGVTTYEVSGQSLAQILQSYQVTGQAQALVSSDKLAIRRIYLADTSSSSTNINISIEEPDSRSMLVLAFWGDLTSGTPPTISGGGKTWIAASNSYLLGDSEARIYVTTNVSDASPTNQITVSWSNSDTDYQFQIYEVINGFFAGDFSGDTYTGVNTQLIIDLGYFTSPFYNRLYIGVGGNTSFASTYSFDEVLGTTLDTQILAGYGNGFYYLDYYNDFVSLEQTSIIIDSTGAVESGSIALIALNEKPPRQVAQAQVQITASGGATIVLQSGQSQSQIKQTYKVYAQSNTWIKTIDQRVYAQALTWIKIASIRGYAQANTWIEASYNGYAQAQTEITVPGATKTFYAQANALIGLTTNLYSFIDEEAPDTSDRIISPPQSTNYYEAQLTTASTPDFLQDVIVRFRALAYNYQQASVSVSLREGIISRASRDISLTGTETEYSFNLTPAEIASITDYSDLRIRFTPLDAITDERVVITWVQVQMPQGTGAKVRRAFGQALALISRQVFTFNAYAQAQASIKQTYQVYAQANAHIKTVAVMAYAQAQAQIKQTYRGYAQAQGLIKQTYQAYAQAQTQIEATYNAYAQAQATIEQIYRAYAQAGAWIEQTYQVYGQAQTWIEQTSIQYANAQAYIEQTYLAYAQAQTQIFIPVYTYSVYGQANAHIKVTDNKVYGQANTWIEITAQGYAQAQTQIEQAYMQYAQAQAIISVANQKYAQAQAQIKQSYLAYAQAQVNIKQTYRVYAQANAWIEITSAGYANAQTTIKQAYHGYGQALAEIKQAYQAYAQANTWIEQSYQAYAQAQAWVEQTYVAYAQAQATVKTSYQGYAQAQAVLEAAYNQSAQAQAKLNAYNVPQFAQALALIAGQQSAHAQAQATIKATANAYGQAQGQIKTTYQAYAQAQAAIKQAYQSYAQAGATIKQAYPAYGQAQGTVKTSYQSYGQAQGYIKVTGNLVFAQAQAQIKQTYLVYAQALATIEATYSAHAQANAYIKVTGNNAHAQAQAYIEQTYVVYAQAQAYIKGIVLAYAQAQGAIKATTYVVGQAQAWLAGLQVATAQAQASIFATSGQYGQAIVYIYIPQIARPIADLSNDGWVRTVI